jgi:hypothetical protein
VEQAVRILNVVFWVAAPLLVLSLFFLDAPVVIAVLMVTVVVSSGSLAWYEFRLNPMADTERGEWTNRQLFFGLVFTITFFVAFIYVFALMF